MYNYKCRRNHVRENYVKYCKELSILTLQDRRKQNDIIFFKKLIAGQIIAPELLRHLNLNVPSRQLRVPQTFRNNFGRIDLYNNMFMSRVQSLCNEKMYSQNLDLFNDSFGKIKKLFRNMMAQY